MENLRAYWAATGRPAEEARLDEALEIAGLGSAIDRQVRGYSQGMRQRLGIAQAMLGLPPLLLLDEPTNGLDPPQIRAMREVLADYAAAGRTVVISSHLLAEIELTCSHVVVMHRGQVILTGAVSELTRSDAVTHDRSGARERTSAGRRSTCSRRWGADARPDGELIRVARGGLALGGGVGTRVGRLRDRVGRRPPASGGRVHEPGRFDRSRGGRARG